MLLLFSQNFFNLFFCALHQFIFDNIFFSIIFYLRETINFKPTINKIIFAMQKKGKQK